jgi:serine/threonine protein kinase
MSVDVSNVPDRERQFQAIVLSCLEALDSSRKPTREELLARYPEFATELTKFLDDQERVDGLAVPLRQAIQANLPNPEVPATGAFTSPRELGDFRLISEVGRGGMGIVYEAEQISLGRRVALKVLPFAATMDLRHLQRFKNEAHAAAQLHHTNIVPVYYVGCERGVHFYAMQYIEGHSLAEVIAELRRQTGGAATNPQPSPSPLVQATVDAQAGQVIAPDSPTSAVRQTKPIAAISTIRSAKDAAYFRTVAELGIQAAEALDFAHEHGIIHRDVKPANLLLDAESRLWVTDFGLAQVQGDARMTMTGDLVGTLRYMSPEQALAKRVVVDHRTDVYSLGATLYELLTLEPAFSGQDRQELLRQIAFEEPRALRRRNKAIPAELETIVLKALEKNPAERYGTAKELADDLRHFLDDKPIRARRPSFALHVQKWFRRHPAVLRSAVAMLLLTLVGLALGSYLIWHEKGKKEAALDLAEKRREAAEKAQQRTRAVLDDMTSEVVDDLMAKQKELTPEQRKFLERALAGYEEFTKEIGETPEQQSSLARAHKRVGNIRGRLGMYAAAEEAYRRAIDIMTALTADFPTESSYFHGLGVCHGNLGDVLVDHGRMLEANSEYQQSVKLLEQIAKGFPTVASYQRDVARTLNNAAGLLRKQGRYRDAQSLLEQAIRYQELAVQIEPTDRPARSFLAIHHLSLGALMQELGRGGDAEVEVREALKVAKQLTADYPFDAESRRSLGLCRSTLGVLHLQLGRIREAELELRQGMRTWQELAEEFPTVPEYRSNLALIHFQLGNVLDLDPKQFGQAETEYRQAIQLQQPLVKQSPASQHYRHCLAESHQNLCQLLVKMRRLSDAETECRKAITIYEQLLKDFPDVLPEAVGVGGSYCNLGNLIAANGQPEKALEWYARAIATLEPVFEKETRFAMGRDFLRIAHLNRAEALDELQRHDEAAKDWDQAVELDERKRAETQLWRAASLAKAGQHILSVRLYREAFAAQPALADDLQHQHRYNAACPAALAGCGQGKDADQTDDKERARLRRQALEWLRADLTAYRQALDKQPQKARAAILQRMQHWHQDKDFAGVRGPEALAKLPECDRKEWQALWEEVETIRKRAAGLAETPPTVPELVPPPRAIDKP